MTLLVHGLPHVVERLFLRLQAVVASLSALFESVQHAREFFIGLSVLHALPALGARFEPQERSTFPVLWVDRTRHLLLLMRRSTRSTKPTGAIVKGATNKKKSR